MWIFLLPFSALAGHEVGNGGNVVSCAAKTPQLLDYVEHGGPPEAPGPYSEQVVGILEALKTVDPELATQYLRRWREWPAEVEIVAQQTLEKIPDSFQASLPADCHLEQIAIRRANPLGEQKRFLIDRDLWEKLSPTQKAGVAMHEIIYEHFSYLGEKDSRSARAFNAYVSTLAERKVTPDAYRSWVRRLKVPLYR